MSICVSWPPFDVREVLSARMEGIRSLAVRALGEPLRVAGPVGALPEKIGQSGSFPFAEA